MRAWFSPYVLLPRVGSAGAGSSPGRRGALLRVELPEGACGFADLHPWPELGDEPLDEQLRRLAGGMPTRLAACSLAMAERDGRARAAGQSLFADLAVPDSHYLALSVETLTPWSLAAVAAIGFRRVKVKVGRDLEREQARLEALSRALEGEPAAAGLRWRLDLNERVTARQAEELLRGLARTRARLDFVEDPCPFEPLAWRALRHDLGIDLALDRAAAVEDALDSAAQALSIVVAKPAVQPAFAWRRAAAQGLRVVFTSYLDHPLGQAHAAREAGAAGATEIAGLHSHLVYEPSAYSEALGAGPRWVPPAGTGIGFDELLDREPWRSLLP